MIQPLVQSVGLLISLAAFSTGAYVPSESAGLLLARSNTTAHASVSTENGYRKRVEDLLAGRLSTVSANLRKKLADALIVEAAIAGFDPLYVLALIQVESSYDPQAVSDKGARGLMQLRPSTLRFEANRSRLGEPSDQMLLNVRAGVRYLHRLERAFKKREVALMAYNAGPHRIYTYLHAAGGIPERFQGYPKRVLSEYHRLRRSYGLEPVTTVARGDAPFKPVE